MKIKNIIYKMNFMGLVQIKPVLIINQTSTNHNKNNLTNNKFKKLIVILRNFVKKFNY